MPSVITSSNWPRGCRALDIPARTTPRTDRDPPDRMSKTRDRAIGAAKAFALRSRRTKPSDAAVSVRRWRSRRHSPSRHVSESGTSRCGRSGQGRQGASEAAGGPSSQPGARRRDTGQPGANGWHQTPNGHAGSNLGSSLATFHCGWNGGTKSLVTCTYSGGHGRWSQWSPQRLARLAAGLT